MRSAVEIAFLIGGREATMFDGRACVTVYSSEPFKGYVLEGCNLHLSLGKSGDALR